jgi:hypothetical protein
MTQSIVQVETTDGIAVIVEDDPTPLVQVAARLVRLAVPHTEPEACGRAGAAEASVTVRSSGDAQALTVSFNEGSIALRHGAASDADAALVVDIANDLAVDTEASLGDQGLLHLVNTLLHPPVPGWRDAAQHFWQRTSAGQGMPQELVLHCTDDDEQLVLGSGLPTYTLSATGIDLARVLSGAAPLLDSVFSGAVAIRGTLPQLSVMAGASNKVRFDV